MKHQRRTGALSQQHTSSRHTELDSSLLSPLSNVLVVPSCHSLLISYVHLFYEWDGVVTCGNKISVPWVFTSFGFKHVYYKCIREISNMACVGYIMTSYVDAKENLTMKTHISPQKRSSIVHKDYYFRAISFLYYFNIHTFYYCNLKKTS